MIQFDRIEDSEGIDLDKTDKSKECKICHYNYCDNGFKSDLKICNRCDWGIKPFGDFGIIHVNDFSYRFFMFFIWWWIWNKVAVWKDWYFRNISRDEAVNRLNNSVLEDKGVL